MVNSNGQLTPEALTHAMTHGDFYASNGVFLTICEKSSSRYSIQIDHERTMRAISKKNIPGKATDPNSTDGYLIEFIGERAKVIHSKQSLSYSVSFPHGTKYLRAKVILTHKGKQYFAWGQSVFLDDNTH